MLPLAVIRGWLLFLALGPSIALAPPLYASPPQQAVRGVHPNVSSDSLPPARAPEPRHVFMLSLANDSQHLGPLPYAIARLTRNPRIDGNDEHFTHASSFEYRYVGRSDGLDLGLALLSELYTSDPLDGTHQVRFSEHNVVAMRVGDPRRDEAFFWAVKAGWQWLNRSEVEGIGAARQQQLFHRHLNADRSAQYEYLPGLLPSQSGPLLDVSLGSTSEARLGDSTDLVMMVSGGGRLSAIARGSALHARSSGALRHSTPSLHMELGGWIDIIGHSEGLQLTPGIEGAVRWGVLGLTNSIEFPRGAPHNFADYNLDREPIARLTILLLR